MSLCHRFFKTTKKISIAKRPAFKKIYAAHHQAKEITKKIPAFNTKISLTLIW